MKFWIARDEGGFIGLYEKEPSLYKTYNSIYEWEGNYIAPLPASFFPEVTFENSPQEVELKLINQ